LQDPDPLDEPFDQRHIVRAATNHRLRKMNMRIDQAGNDQLPADIHDLLIWIPLFHLLRLADSRNTIINRSNRPVADNLALRVHRNNGCVCK
jgi:hypothetical protein